MSLRSARSGSALRTAVAATVGVVVATVGVAAVAWACVPQPYLVVQPRASGAVGDEVEVVGENFDPGPVEVRWNALDGELLGKAAGPSFAAKVIVPEDEAGLYSLLAISRGPQGQVVGIARVAFSLTGAEPGVAPAGDASGAGAGGSGSGTGDSSSSPIAPMAFGAALVAAGGAAGAGAMRWSGRRRASVQAE